MAKIIDSPTSISDLRVKAQEQIESICRELLPSGKQVGKDWRAGDITGAPGSSLAVCLEGERAGCWIDHANPDDKGDVVDLWMRVLDVDFDSAIRQISNFCCMPLSVHNGNEDRAKSEQETIKVEISTENLQPLTEGSPGWLYLTGTRKLEPETLAEFRIMEKDAGQTVVFPTYTNSGRLFSLKFQRIDRTDGKIMWQSPGPKQHLFGWQAYSDKRIIDKETGLRTVAITEGENDTITISQFGYFALSLPSGASNLTCLEHDAEQLGEFDRILIATDDDEPGSRAAEKIAARLGPERCERVTFGGHKDANEALQAGWDGSDFWEATRSATEFPLRKMEQIEGAAISNQNTPPEPNSEFLYLPSPKVPITDSAKQIFTRIAKGKRMFFRAGSVVEARIYDDEAFLTQVTPSAFRSRLEEYGPVCVHRADRNCGWKYVLKPTICPEQTSKALLEAEPTQILPPVSLVASCPLLVDRDGAPFILTRGWHPDAGGTFISSGENLVLPILDDAVAMLLELIDGFCFPSEEDRARALTLFITVALRAGGLLDRSVPMFTIEADASQTGKGYLTKIVGAVFHQRLAIVGQRSGGVGSLDESLSQRLIEGRPLIVLDNFRGKLDSTFLEAFLTAEGLVPARVPHRAEMQVDARRMTLLATSNGFIATPDLANRIALIRLRKQPLNHQFKRWPEGDLLSHVEANQPQYLGAVYAIIAEWIRRGRPRTDENRHSFREWAQPLDWICQNLLGVGPLLDGHMEAAERTSNPARAWLREFALHVIEIGRGGESLSASSIRDICEEADLSPPGARPDWQGAEKTIGLVMGRLFKAVGEDFLDADVAIVTRSERSEPTPSGTNRMMKLYTFHRSGETRT